MNHSFQKLDKGKGTLRVLKLLYELGELDQQTLRREASMIGIGSTAIKSSIAILHELKLINVNPKPLHPKGQPSLMHSLTEKGRDVAAKALEIEELLR